MNDPPAVDILLLRRQQSQWTASQRALLPDGIRDSHASQILIEFKYTESLNEEVFGQALGYDLFYKRAKRLASSEVQAFLVSAKTPQAETLTTFGYQMTSIAGVYHSQDYWLRRVKLIVLNELSGAPHNAFFKCFASRKTEKQKAFDTLKRTGLQFLTLQLEWFLTGLLQLWFNLTGDDMKGELTPEKVMEMGKQWGDWYLSNLTVEQRLAGLNAEQRLAGLNAEQRLAGLTPEEIENYLLTLKAKPPAKKNSRKR